MKEDLLRLIALQEIDMQIKRLNDELASSHANIHKRQASITEKKEKIDRHKLTIENAENRRKELEAEVEAEVTHIKDRQSKLMNVQTNREYQSLLKEIEESKKNNKRREEETVLLMEQVETLQKKVLDQGTACLAEEQLLAEVEEKTTQLAQETLDKREKIEKTREQQVKKIPDNLRRRYDQLLAKRNGLAITGVINGVCQGCFMNIPAQQFNELLRGEQLLSCPTCQRMMFHQSPATEE